MPTWPSRSGARRESHALSNMLSGMLSVTRLAYLSCNACQSTWRSAKVAYRLSNSRHSSSKIARGELSILGATSCSAQPEKITTNDARKNLLIGQTSMQGLAEHRSQHLFLSK